jgi:hypothetical protein
MKKSAWLFLSLILAPLLTAQAQAAKTIGSFTFILGGPQDVQIRTRGSAVWSAAKLGLGVKDGDAVKTQKESRCEIKLLDASVIRIGEVSDFEFTQANISAVQRKVKAELKSGQVYVNLNTQTSAASSFQIKAPTAVCAVRGTIYRVDGDSTTQCTVYDGTVQVGPAQLWGQPIKRSGGSLQPFQVPGPTQIPGPYEVSLDQWVQIVKGFQIRVRADGKYNKSQFDQTKDAQLDWVKWNKEMDTKIGR